MITINNDNEGYLKGDKVKLTGKKKIYYGEMFYEFVYREGINYGEKGWNKIRRITGGMQHN